jgi:prepilin-type N-terminal cleavage/methylation domain-containing protein/uncharacterized protein (TIGR02145 family)
MLSLTSLKFCSDSSQFSPPHKVSINKNDRAFTLIELLVVIAIIGILTSLVLVSLSGIREDARDARRESDMAQISQAMEMYNIAAGSYLDTTAGTNTVTAIGSYLAVVPTDPLNSSGYYYTWTANNTISGDLLPHNYYCVFAPLEGETGYFCASNKGVFKSTTTTLPTSDNCCWTQGGGSFVCGDTVTFTYKGSSVTYGTVSHNSKCWLDRNLGASQVATAYNNSAAYGDLFQWGRLGDQHQTRTSGTQPGLSSTDIPGHSNFIYGMGSPYDWRSPQKDTLWQGVSGINNPCPSGWRIPTETEWNTERLSWSSNDYYGAYASPLKLTAGGYRSYSDASLFDVGSNGYYWSSTVGTSNARYLYFDVSNAFMYSGNRAYGFSVRCMQD